MVSGRKVTVVWEVPRVGGPGRGTAPAATTKVVKHSRRGVKKIGQPDSLFVADLQNMLKVTSQMNLLAITCDDEANKMDVVQD